MWRLVVQQAGLAQHLAALRRYLLLGQGDFYHAFLTLVRGSKLGLPELPCTSSLGCGAAKESGSA